MGCVNSVKPSAANPLIISTYKTMSSKLNAYDFTLSPLLISKIETSTNFGEAALIGDMVNFRFTPTEQCSEAELESSQMIISQEKDQMVVKKYGVGEKDPIDLLEADQKGFFVSVTKMRDLGNQGVIIQQGDMFSIGRKIFRVRTLNLSEGQEDIYDMIEEEKGIISVPSSTIEHTNNICRICHENSCSPIFNPMLSPCKCTGSSKYIHFLCLLRQVESNKFVKLKSLFTITYDLRALTCDICLASFPETFEHEGKMFSLINEKTINPPYILLEVTTASRKRLHSIHCIKLNFNSIITIGSDKKNDIRINDKYVSGMHAKFRIKSDGVFLSNEESSCGTYKFFRTFKLNKYFNNVDVCFESILVKLFVVQPVEASKDDLPSKSVIKIRFSKLKSSTNNESEDYENILYLDETEQDVEELEIQEIENHKKVEVRKSLLQRVEFAVSSDVVNS